MKKYKIINRLLILLFLTILFGCNETKKRILFDELSNKGTKESQLMYYEGELFNGIGYNVDQEGQLIEEKNYTNGKWNGKWIIYYENDKFRKRRENSRIKELAHTIRYKDNEKYKIRLEKEGKDGKKDGLIKSWFKNGQLESERNYKDGKKDGLFKFGNENGQIYQVMEFKDGIECGYWKYYDEDGQLVREVNMDEQKANTYDKDRAPTDSQGK